MSSTSTDHRTPRRRTQAERTEESSRRLIEAAIDLILERGSRGTTLKEVGERAGYSRGLANYRFGSKEGLFLEVLLYSRRHWREQLERELGDQRGLDAILAATDAFRRYLRCAPRHYQAMIMLWYDAVGHPSALNAKLAAHHSIQLRDVRGWVEQGIADGTIDAATDPAGFAASFYSCMFGTVYQWQLQPELFDLDRMFENYKFLVLRALTPDRN
ncbi:TetR family transcriptional regulator [Salinisphaera orenii MK-B5]|uniref:TetR family transcriptional regulator n=1 Tax=Salinisphaera orenii MK-B5 TaxID=856730 RepID=A0A423PG31_9GAMM|nr:TetR family transcriptional regulator [Salinisphaera orenii]ROO24525.1 TetR family transcriptional regulator [Salinisphaera orenii MK-B5]